MKAPSLEKKKAATPVILIEEEQDLTSTVLIGQMLGGKQNTSSVKQSQGKFSGGFKYRPEDNKNVKVDNSSLVNPSQMDKFTVYDEFGIINDSIGKKKYRQTEKQVEKSRIPVQASNISRQMSGHNPWRRQDRNVAQNNYLDSNVNVYEMSNLKGREQTAVHMKSSLEVINLDNIEAKLAAHKQTMRPIEEQYNMIKGKSSIRPEGSSKEKWRFNVDVDKEYKNMKPSQVYQIIKDKQDQLQKPKEEVLLEELWEEKKKKDPKLAQYDYQYQQFRVEKEAKKMIGGVVKSNLYTWDKYAKNSDLQQRKVARMHKSKQKQYGDQIESKVISKAYGQSSISPSKYHEEIPQAEPVDIQQKIATKDDKFIGKYIMAEIDVDKRGTISKDELSEYLSTKDHIIKGYHIDLKWLHTDLDNFETKRKGMLDRNEVVQFLATLDSIHHPEMKLKNVEKSKPVVQFNQEEKGAKDNKLFTLYFKVYEKHFMKLFDLLDVNEDRIIKREEFLQTIFLDSECNKFMEQPAIKLKIIDKRITFRQILGSILDDYRKQKNQKLKKSKEYISFERFKQYFQLPQNLDLKMFDKAKNDKMKKDKSSVQVQIFDIQDEYLLMLKDIFDTIPRVYQDYIVASDFVSISLKDPQILAISQQICRIQSVQTQLPVETILSTLVRMTKDCDQYASWDILKTYFSRRGRPLDWDYDLLQKKKQLRQSKLRDGNDFAKTKLASTIKFDPEQTMRRDPFSDTVQSKMAKGISKDKYTVPQPFDITDERRKSKMKSKEMSTEEKEIEEMKKKFKAKPVNKQILVSNPDLIQGKVGKEEKSFVYQYENYENDRIQRLLKKAQEEEAEKERLNQIKRLAQVKASSIKVDLNKKLVDIVEEKNKNKEKSKFKPTVPNAGSNLYPDPKEHEKKKMEKIKKNIDKQNEAENMRQNNIKNQKDRLKQKNIQIKKHAEQQKKKEEEEKRQRDRLNEDSHKPKINKRDTSEADKEAIRQNKEERQRKKQDEIQKVMEIQNKKKQKRLEYEKKEKKLQIDGLEDEQILNRLEEVDFEDLLLDEGDKMAFRKEFQFKDKTRKQIKQRFRGLAHRERAAMQAQQRRLAGQKKKKKEQKQSKIVKQKVDAAKQKVHDKTGTLNVETEFHCSKALRRYRALIEGKQPLSQFDSYSKVGNADRSDDI